MVAKGANSMATSGLVLRSDLVDTGRAISILFGINGVRNQQSHLVGPLCSTIPHDGYSLPP